MGFAGGNYGLEQNEGGARVCKVGDFRVVAVGSSWMDRDERRPSNRPIEKFCCEVVGRTPFAELECKLPMHCSTLMTKACSTVI